MVKVVDFKDRVTSDGRTFYVLVLEGGVEVVPSKVSGKPYFRKKIVTVPTSFDEDVCKALIDSEFEGSIENRACDPYEIVIEETGEVIEVSTRNEFIPKVKIQETQVIEETEVV